VDLGKLTDIWSGLPNSRPEDLEMGWKDIDLKRRAIFDLKSPKRNRRDRSPSPDLLPDFF